MKKLVEIVVLSVFVALVIGACTRVGDDPCGDLRTALATAENQIGDLKLRMGEMKSKVRQYEEIWHEASPISIRTSALLDKKTCPEIDGLLMEEIHVYEQWIRIAKGEKAYFDTLAQHFPNGFGSLSDWVEVVPLQVLCSKSLTEQEKRSWFSQVAENQKKLGAAVSITYESAEKRRDADGYGCSGFKDGQ